ADIGVFPSVARQSLTQATAFVPVYDSLMAVVNAVVLVPHRVTWRGIATMQCRVIVFALQTDSGSGRGCSWRRQRIATARNQLRHKHSAASVLASNIGHCQAR